ncbi:helix-turn-helix transcriptional regulator [Actinomadura sp. WMMB 499]|uniref:helix-turn-helix domain-containing protein n=1 Tax=Actinomadura sp. WMMB 499 TaxID=1219491 RepID=UPI00159D84AE|nr:helix-turn-helix transcriptional regulator [Actinomadura sp. WMMB 499]
MVGDALKKFREDLGLTQRAAGRLCDRSQASLSAYENGHRAIRPRDLKHILDMYDIADEVVRARLLSLAAQGRQNGWWNDFEERFEVGVIDHVSLEADSSHIRIFDPLLVTGLLQTDEYARAVIAASGTATRTPRDIEIAVGFRMQRQRLHEQDRPPKISVVLGEAALRQLMGGPDAMRRQCDKLISLSARPHVELRILPFGAGAHAGVDGAFTILSVGPDSLLEVVAIDSLTRSWYVDEPADVDLHSSTFERLQEVALSELHSRRLIEQVASEL